MNDVTRYRHDGVGFVGDNESGEWVSYDDYAALESALEAARGVADMERNRALRVEEKMEGLGKIKQDRDAAVAAIRAMCERHCNIKPDDLCAVPECPGGPYRPTSEEGE
jgi:hypothetical protein